VSTMSRVRPSSGTGAGTFDVPEEFDFGVFDDAVDRTPLNLDDIPDLGLGAVLKKWDDTLTPGSLVRHAAWSSLGTASAGLPLEDVDVAFVADDYPVTSTAMSALDEVAETVRNLAGSPIVDQADSLAAGVTRPLCRLVVGPVTASGSYHQVLWVLVTGDEVRNTLTGRMTEALASGGTDSPALPVRPDEQSAVDVVADLQRLLDVPAAKILRASGISRRTYQHWKATGATPRLNSQARLWDLALTARGWADVLGDDLVAWIRHPDRLDLLDNGEFEALTGQVLSEQARRVSDTAWYRDRLAAGYFETIDSDLEAVEDQPGKRTGDRQPRSARRVRRARPAGGVRRSTT
jgi:uncharacterized protein (DUF2384 family)